MKISQREVFLLIATLYSVLFAGTAMLAKPRIEELKACLEEQEDVKLQIARDTRLVERKPVLQTKYDELSKLLRPATRPDMGVHWQQVLERIASKNKIRLINSKAGTEKRVGDVYEILIECRSWEGDLDSLVHFLFDLQAEGAMLDVRRMSVKEQNGQLSGTFALFCLYTRPEKESENDQNAQE